MPGHNVRWEGEESAVIVRIPIGGSLARPPATGTIGGSFLSVVKVASFSTFEALLHDFLPALPRIRVLQRAMYT